MNQELDIDLLATSAYRIVNDYFDITLYRPTEGRIIFMANPTLHKRGWQREMKQRLSTLQARVRIDRDKETYRITVFPMTHSIGAPSLTNILLFVATFFTVLAAAAYQEVGGALISDPYLIYTGIPFTVTLMIILLLHEMGHFWAGYKRGIVMSYPFFIPAPTILGTFGAVIRSRSPISNRNDLILVGAAGPLSGVVPALIALIIGYAGSDLVARTSPPLFTIGNSLITLAAQKIFFGDFPSSMIIHFSPIALAGKVGLLVTMLNLLPLGQLDGGHIVYGLIQKGQHRLAIIFMVVLAGLGFLWAGWWVWLVLAAIMRPFHPAVIDKTTAVDFRHRMIGWIAVLLFIVTFAPLPIY
jgi:membrane-associated protease RseP (regulator of RpoE activity)